MADEENNEADEANLQDAADGEKKNRGPAKLLAGIAGLIATGSALAMMAIPSKEAPARMTGPFEFAFFEEEDDPNVVTNTQDDNFSRYIKFKPTSLIFAYDPAYPAARRAEQGFIVAMREAMSRTILKYHLDQIYSRVDEFNEELRQAAEPILFPVCFGEAESTFMADPSSGLMPGDSQETRGTFRGDFYSNEMQVDALRGALQLGKGPEQSFNGSETDLMIEDGSGQFVFVDVTGVKDDFVGNIQIGVKGRIRRLITGTIVAQ